MTFLLLSHDIQEQFIQLYPEGGRGHFFHFSFTHSKDQVPYILETSNSTAITYQNEHCTNCSPLLVLKACGLSPTFHHAKVFSI